MLGYDNRIFMIIDIIHHLRRIGLYVGNRLNVFFQVNIHKTPPFSPSMVLLKDYIINQFQSFLREISTDGYPAVLPVAGGG
jgi:hypothetical protein